MRRNRIDYRLRWDMSKYPYAPVKTTAEDADNGIDNPVRAGAKHLEELLGWAARTPAPVRTATQVYDWLDPSDDDYVVSLSQLEKVLLHHPAYVALESKDKFSPKGFIPLKTLLESACGYLLTWCSHADPKEPVPDTLGERICRLVSNPYQLESDDLWGLLEQVGLIEKLGDGIISVAYLRTFLSFCRHWRLHPEVVFSWDGFQVRAQCRISKPIHVYRVHGDYWLSQFEDNEKILIEKRLIDGYRLEDLGRSLGVTRERARQIINKLIARLVHPTFWNVFGYVWGQNLLGLPSMRLVHPDEIAKKMEDYFERRIASRSLCEILRKIAKVEPIQVYDSDWLWINWGKDLGELPGLEHWENEYDINEEDYISSVGKKCAGGLRKAEGDILFRCAKESHRSPKRLRPCTIRTLNVLKRPAHFKVIAEKAQELFPDFPNGLSVGRIDPVLQRLAQEGKHVIKVESAVYALHEYRNEEILHPPPPPSPPPPIGPWRDNSFNYDAILAKIENGGDPYKNLFDGLNPKEPDAVREAILRVIQAVEALPIPRSLCELHLDREGYQWLISWAEHVDTSALRSLLDDYDQYFEWGKGNAAPVALGTGLLLLLFVAEVGRREAVSSMLWPFVRERLNEDARKVVFQGEQSINQRFKDMMESTCRKFNLRHVLGQEGMHSYYVTLTLQYGFALSHVEQLPLMLTERKSLRAFDLLLGPLKSASFHRLFQTLRDFRFNRISRDQATKILDVNPWVLPEKTKDVLDAAKSAEGINEPDIEEDVLPLFVVSEDPAGINEPDIEEDEPQILPIEKRRLQWDGVGEPFFVCPLQQLDLINLIEERYDLFVGEQHLDSLFRDANGSYRGQETVHIPLENPRQVIHLRDREGRTRYTQELQLWDEEDDLSISVFQFPSGRKINAWESHMNTQSQYGLLTLADLEIEPPVEPWRLVGAGKWRLILLQKGWSSDLKITIGGEVFWSPLSKSEPVPSPSGWEQKIQIKTVPSTALEFGDKFDLIIKNVPPDIKISHAIFCKRSVAVTTMPREAQKASGEHRDMAPVPGRGYERRIESIELTPEVAFAVWRGSKIELHLDRNGEKKRVRLPTDLDFKGSVIERKPLWDPVFLGRDMTVGELESHRVQVFVPKHWRGTNFDDLALMEGSRFLRRLWKRPRTLDGLVGLGAPLKVQKPYNCLPEEKVLTLVAEIINRGIIDRVLMDEALVEIFLHRDVEPGPDHFLIGVSPNGLVSQFEIGAYDGRQWRVDVNGPLVACGLAYRGECVGSWWKNDIDTLNTLTTAHVQDMAAMMRWLHLPLLKPTWKAKVIRFIETNLVRVLSVWMQDRVLFGGLRFNETSETWFANVGELFSEIYVDPEHASTLVDFMARDLPTDLGGILHRLGKINPIFMGRVLWALLALGYRNFEASEWRDHLQSAKRRFLFLPSQTSEQDIMAEEKRRRDEAAQSMKIHPAFIDSIAQNGVKLARDGQERHLSAMDRENLEIALNVQPFNRYLCVNIFNDVIFNLRG